jgi:hypothetical protein
MALKDMSKQAVEKQLKALSQANANKALAETAGKHYKMANDFFKEKNYSTSFYTYYLSFKEYASIVVSKKVKTLVEPEEALNYLVKKKEFGLNKNLLKKVEELKNKVLNREKLAREKCVMIRNVIVRMRKEAL